MKIGIFNFCFFVSRVCGCQWFINNPIRFLKKRYLWTALTDLNHFNSIFDFCLLFTFLWRVFTVNKCRFYDILICHAIVITLKVAVFCPWMAETKHLLSIAAWSHRKLLYLLCGCYNIKSGSFFVLVWLKRNMFFFLFSNLVTKWWSFKAYNV